MSNTVSGFVISMTLSIEPGEPGSNNFDPAETNKFTLFLLDDRPSAFC